MKRPPWDIFGQIKSGAVVGVDLDIAAGQIAGPDRTLGAAEAQIDLRDFGQPVRLYAGYRDWLASLRTMMVAAQRITGGLRLQLDGDRAKTRVPVVCYVTMEIDGARTLTSTGLFYNDVLARTADGWRIVERYEELAWSGAPWPLG